MTNDVILAQALRAVYNPDTLDGLPWDEMSPRLQEHYFDRVKQIRAAYQRVEEAQRPQLWSAKEILVREG